MPKGVYDRKKTRRKKTQESGRDRMSKARGKVVHRKKKHALSELLQLATPKRSRAARALQLAEKYGGGLPGRPVPARIDRVSFRSMIELARFQHAHVEVSAAVPTGSTAEVVLDQLKRFVAEQLRITKDGITANAPVPGRFRDLLTQPDAFHNQR